MDVLLNKSYKSYDYLSRYLNFPYYYNSRDKKYIYGTTSQISKNISYYLYEVKDDDTLDSIALDVYNNPTYFWAIADFNNIQDPYLIPKVGDKIKIPLLSEIKYKEL